MQYRSRIDSPGIDRQVRCRPVPADHYRGLDMHVDKKWFLEIVLRMWPHGLIPFHFFVCPNGQARRCDSCGNPCYEGVIGVFDDRTLCKACFMAEIGGNIDRPDA